ncbi:Type II traffic warden ATPase [Sedimentisphaera cyanobacteriorum]|uniref:Type II traffic warden ATPase n=1 Tax=Sedimentisphaera cyanobacteriorum TaxID=1940790 RepID=A0A1Q2HPR3_9BACT|nr:GspE/PulE family protein [Sedimentisphaera cyanobacteriorum]AQQ09452.1 Type II traffic warden ATPase [Sedimentisphaera cyanobacteriorum]
MAKKKRIGEILYGRNLVDKLPLAKAVKTAQKTDRLTGEVLVEMGAVTEDDVASALAKQAGMKYADFDQIRLPENVETYLPKDIVKSLQAIPFGEENGKMKIIISDPRNLEALDTLRFKFNKDLECYVGSPTRIREYINKATDVIRDSIDKATEDLFEEGETIESTIKIAGNAEQADDDGPVIKLANLIIDEAVNMGASDIHIESMASRVRIRYRIDGVCIERSDVPKNMQNPLIARFKILSNMDIAERRIPQDGRIKREYKGTQIDFRVSCLPGYHGPSIVLRILRPDNVNIGIQALGFDDELYGRFEKIIKRPNGIFLVTGPTGSGKTTTLYSALKELNRPDKKIITAEDPVEYMVGGINQCQVNTEIKLDFSTILRSMLRQSPNVILVGEIRDGEVADIAIQAALTGHLVFSTLHTNDASSAVARLIDMGVKPFLVASSIQAIMAQRLVRRICSECKEVDHEPDSRYLRALNIQNEDFKEKPIYKGKGCSRCNGTGYKGRMAIFEMLEMNTELRELAFACAPTQELRKAALSSGMRPLVEDGIKKIFSGYTTPEEVARVAQSDEIVIE